MNTNELGKKVAGRRQELALNQEDLAKAAKISRNYISLIERGEAQNISANVLNQLADALGMTMSELIGQPTPDSLLISRSLRQFGIDAGLSFEVVEKLARIPRRGREPQTTEEWQLLYDAIKSFIDAEG